MTAIKVKQIDRRDRSAIRSRARSLRAKLGSELLATNGRDAIQQGGKVITALLLIGLTIDLALEAYLVWQSWTATYESG
jgi:hypothetical protein